MPLSKALSSRGQVEKGEGHIHTDKWHRCWTQVQAKGATSDSAAAICTSSIGYKESLNKESRTKGPHSSDKKKKAKKHDVSYAQVLRVSHANH